MGSALSRTTQSAKQASTVGAAKTAAEAPRASPTARASSPRSNNVGNARPKRDDWAEALKNISGVISSRAWEGQAGVRTRVALDKEMHPAQRDEGVIGKLPSDRRVSKVDTGTARPEHGRLTQGQLLALFRLRKQDAQKWNADALAERFKVEPKDMHNLLKYTRTYTGKLDDDGAVRGYYNADSTPRVMRFEAD